VTAGRDRALLLLCALLVAAALGPAFLAHAPNRLLSGAPLRLSALPGADSGVVFGFCAACVAAALLPASRVGRALVAAASLALFAAVLWAAGDVASQLARTSAPSARTSLGAGAWLLALFAWLAYAHALRGLRLRAATGAALALLPTLVLAALLASGAMSDLSLLREYANRRAAFAGACLRHIALVGMALAATLPIGLPLGVLAQRHARVRAALFPMLNVVQTIPSIALYGLLLPLLSGLAMAVPALARAGLGGVGAAPAVIALTLYALLPLVRNVTAGLDGVPAPVVEAARGIGMGRRAVLWRVEAPLAAPVILAGLRIALVQVIGLAIIAALIGAGGLGDIIFQGLFANALDLVLLGVVPVVAMALFADAAMRLLAAAFA
jgi:osmoprotectant transport system permease protein